MKNYFKLEMKKLYKWLSDNVIIIINFSYILSLIGTFSFDRYKNIWLIFLIVYFVILETFKSIIRKMRSDKIPILKKDLTYVNEKGDISIDEVDLQKGIIYLNMIEKYIKNNNLR